MEHIFNYFHIFCDFYHDLQITLETYHTNRICQHNDFRKMSNSRKSFSLGSGTPKYPGSTEESDEPEKSLGRIESWDRGFIQ